MINCVIVCVADNTAGCNTLSVVVTIQQAVTNCVCDNTAGCNKLSLCVSQNTAAHIKMYVFQIIKLPALYL